jgi:hypothetical protein
LIEACHRGNFDAAAMLLVFGAKKIKDSTCLAIRNGHYRIAALLLVCYAALTGDVNTLEMLLDKSLECYDWLQQFVDESVPIATVVENIRLVNQKRSFRMMFFFTLLKLQNSRNIVVDQSAHLFTF